MNRFLTTIFMLSIISFMILLSSFIEYDNHELNTEYNVYYAFDNLYNNKSCLLYTSPSPRDGLLSRMPSSA